MKVLPNLISTLGEMYRIYFGAPAGVSDVEISVLLGIHRQQVNRYRKQMPGVYQVTRGRYSCVPTPYQIEQAQAVIRRAEYEKRLKSS